MALRLEQSVRSTVHHHGGRGHSDDGHTITDTGLQAVVPLVIGHREQTWVDRERGESEVWMEERGHNVDGSRRVHKISKVGGAGLQESSVSTA